MYISVIIYCMLKRRRFILLNVIYVIINVSVDFLKINVYENLVENNLLII